MFPGMEGTRLPTFVVIGAMRGGTTTLYYDLLGHPEVFMAPIKEPNFFAFLQGGPGLPLDAEGEARLRAVSITDPIDYARLFVDAHSARAVGEVSPTYLYSPAVPRRLKTTIPNVKVIAVLRNPVDRAYSAYLRRANVEPSFSAFVETAEREHRRLDEGRRLPLYPLILGGLYSRHLTNYLTEFPASQRLIFIYETFWPSYPASLATVHEFVGVTKLPPSQPQVLNRSGVPRFSPLDALLRRGDRWKMLTKQYLPKWLIKNLVRVKQMVEDWSLQESSELPASIRAYLLDTYFAEDISQLEDMIGQDLSIWRR